MARSEGVLVALTEVDLLQMVLLLLIVGFDETVVLRTDCEGIYHLFSTQRAYDSA